MSKCKILLYFNRMDNNETLQYCITAYKNRMYHINYLLLPSKYYMNQTESQTFLTPIN